MPNNEQESPPFSLVFTVLNEADTMDQLLQALDSQTALPDETVVVDGGSHDGTIEKLNQWGATKPSVKIHIAPGVNISAGRNLAIDHAENEIIAVTDGGCTPEPQWLERLIAGFTGPQIDVVMGFYRPDPRNAFEAICSCLNLPGVTEVDPGKFMPSSRSIAFRRRTWQRAGRYPEWMDVGEDMYFNFCVLALGARRQFAPEAVVKWRLRPGLKTFFRQYFNYAKGDAVGGMYLSRHLVRFFAYSAGAGLAGAWVVAPWTLGFPVLVGAVWLWPAYRRAFSRLSLPQLALALPSLPMLHLVMDVAKMTGYLAGLFGKR